MTDDAQLLRRYATDRSEAAFAELVQRHLNLVYSAALRQANGDTHLAQDATQLVFADLARKAASVANRAVLAGWLFTSTRFAVAKLVRGERRRQAREQEAQIMNETSEDAVEKFDWGRVRPVLDEVLAELNDADREAVLLRYFEGRDYAGVGDRLNLSENAARMRVERALDKLQGQLRRRGLTSSTAALTAALATQAVLAAPAGLGPIITGAALAGAAPVGVAGAIATFMTINKWTAALAGVITVAGTTGFVVQARTNTELQAELQQVRQENQAIAPLREQNLRLTRLAAEAEAMRADDVALAQLNDEADAIKGRLQAAVRANEQDRSNHEVYNPGKLDRMPRAKTQVRPEYPQELRTAGVEGEVMVDFIVDSTGAVRNAYPAKSTRRELESAATEAVSKWTFEPGLKNGRQVNTHMEVNMVFRMAQREASAGVPTPVAAAKKP